MAQENQHLTTEQLSALLDGEVSAEERTQWEAHLKTCQRCQQELAALRQTVALLRALPQPALPRSFELPPVEIAEPAALFTGTRQAAAHTAPPQRAQERHRPGRPYLRFAFRTLSAVAAMIGIVFVLSALGPALLERGSAVNSTSYSSSGSASSNAQGPVPATPSTGIHAQSVMTPASHPATTPAAGQKTSAADHTTTPDESSQPPSLATWPVFLFFNLSTPEGRLGLGILLFVLGMMGYILFRRKRARAP